MIMMVTMVVADKKMILEKYTNVVREHCRNADNKESKISHLYPKLQSTALKIKYIFRNCCKEVTGRPRLVQDVL